MIGPALTSAAEPTERGHTASLLVPDGLVPVAFLGFTTIELGRLASAGGFGRLKRSRLFGQFEGFDKVYPGCEVTPSSSRLIIAKMTIRPARRIMRRGQRAEQDRAERMIDAMRRVPFIASVQYCPRTRRVRGGLGVRPTSRKRAVEVVLWLANHRMLPRRVTI